MMPYQVFQLYQVERTKTTAEIRRADDRLGELSYALSSVWHQFDFCPRVLPATLSKRFDVSFCNLDHESAAH